MKSTLIYTDEKSNKFWTIETDRKALTVTYGKVGTFGQTAISSFDTEEKCNKEAEKLIAEKIKKGYVEGVNEVTAEAKEAALKAEKKKNDSRPASVPQDAAFDKKDKVWYAAIPGAPNYVAGWNDDSLYISFAPNAPKKEQFIGRLTAWTKEGKLLETCDYTKKGYVVTQYHPDETIARQSEYQGENPTDKYPGGFSGHSLRGKFVYQRCEGETSFPFPKAPDNVWRIEGTCKGYDESNKKFFDKSGNQIDTTTVPTRPANVDAKAKWMGEKGIWKLEIAKKEYETPIGKEKSWNKEGLLVEEINYRQTRVLVTHYHPDGSLAEELSYESSTHSKSNLPMFLCGICIYQRCDGATTYKFPEGIEKNVWKMIRAFTVDEQCYVQALFNKNGNQINAPERPQSVPKEAFYNELEELWMQIIKDETGDDKEWNRYRKDGSLFRTTRISLTEHKQIFLHSEIYHPDGTLYLQTEYRTDHAIPEGTFICQRSENPTEFEFPYAQLFPPVTDEVWKIVKTEGTYIEEKVQFFDKNGNLLKDKKDIVKTARADKKAKAEANPGTFPQGEEIEDEAYTEPWPGGTKITSVDSSALAKIISSGKYFDKSECLQYAFENEGDALLIDGDVHLKGNVNIGGLYAEDFSIVVINGNLTIDGTLEYGDGDWCIPFMVLGDFKAQNAIVSECYFMVNGNTGISGMLLWLYEGHFVANGEFNVGSYYGRDNYLEIEGEEGKPENTVSAEDFLPKFIEDADCDIIRPDKVCEAILAGKPLFGKKKEGEAPKEEINTHELRKRFALPASDFITTRKRDEKTENDTNNEIAQLNKKASSFMASGDYTEASQVFENAYAQIYSGTVASDYNVLFLFYGLTYCYSNMVALAVDEAGAGVIINRLRSFSRATLGLIPEQIMYFSESAAFQRECTRVAGNAYAWWTMMVGGDMEDALAAVNFAAHCIEDDAHNFILDTKVRILLKMERTEEAYRIAAIVLSKNPEFADFQNFKTDENFLAWAEEEGIDFEDEDSEDDEDDEDDEDGDAPLFNAVAKKNVAKAKSLILKGADLNPTNYYNATPLALACRYNQCEEIALLLIEAGADYNKTDDYKQTPFQLAAEGGCEQVVKVLLAKGCPVNDQTHDGSTAIQWASEHGHKNIVKMLLEHGADPKVKNKAGKDAFKLSKTPEIKEMMKGK